jgi:hypothetical protein
MIVIPTYKRYNIKTITLLEKEGFTIDEITIYVANQEEKDLYLLNYPNYTIIIGVLGIKNQREFIQTQYPEGTILISIDDDIESFTHKDKNLRQIFNECIEYLSLSSAGLLSFNPSSNPFFSLRPWQFKQGRYLCCGFIHIFKVNYSIIGDIENVEDYDRSMMYLKKYGSIIRYGQVCFKTKFCAKGSFQLRENYELNVDKLLAKYPNDLYFNIKKSGYLKGLKNIKLRVKHK